MQQTFGAFLRHLRKRSGMTQGELAERLGYSRSMVGALELDERLPNVDEVIDTYVPALGLQSSREEAARLVELAANARQVVPPPAFATHPVHAPLLIAQNSDTHRIPLPPTRLLGRDRDVETLAERFLYQEVRLATLVGPPGVGKTRLAQEVATRLAHYYQDGACFVALAGVTTPDGVAGSILAALDVHAGGGTPMAALTAHLRRKQILLVLDNFEQVLVAAPLVADLLAECAGLRLLVTSRERLHLRAEHIAAIQPLALVAAADLFLARAVAANDRLLFADVDGEIVRNICQRLDCLPLAIELCAARTDFYDLEQIDEYLRTHPLDTLVDGPADLPPHHRTLRGAIQASYSLLNDDERALLRALSVFVGGASPAMAEEVWAGDRVGARFSDVVRSLVAKSLVQVETTALGDKRLLLLESVREFALEQIEADASLSTLRARHFDVMLGYARMAEARIWTPDAAIWIRRMRQELENWSVGMEWAFEHALWQEIASLLILLWRSLETFPRRGVLFDWFERLLAVAHNLDPDLHMAIRTLDLGVERGHHWQRETLRQEYQKCLDACTNPLVKALAWVASVVWRVDLLEKPEALALAVENARAGRTTPEFEFLFGYGWSREAMLPICLEFSGIQRVEHGETVESTALLTEALAHYRARGHVLEKARSSGFLGRAALLEGRDAEAIAWFEEALESAVALGNTYDAVEWRAYLGQAIVYTGNLERARELLAQAWEDAVPYGVPFLMQSAALCSGELAFAEGNIEEARQWLAESVALARQTTWLVAWQPIHRALLAAQLAAVEGEDLRAAAFYGFAYAYSDRIKIGPTGPMRDTAAPTMAEVRARLGEEAYRRAYEEGGCLSAEDILAVMAEFGSHR